MSRLFAASLLLLLAPVGAAAQWQFNGVPVSTADHYQADPLIVADGTGGAIIAWFDYRSGNYDIYAQRLNAAGVPQWTADGVPLCTQPGNQITISMVSDDAGGAVVVWQDARGNSLDIFAQRVNASGTPLWDADGALVCAAGADQNDPIIIKSANNFVIAWFDFRFAGVADIYAQALNASGAPLWLADGVALCTAAGNQFHPRLATDGVGGAIVAWEDRRSGPDDIYARLVDRFGNVQWAADGVVVCNATAEQYSPQIVGDGAAGAIIAWYDWRGGNTDIYMQRIDSGGIAQWTANGAPICTAPFSQGEPSLAQDFSGGAVVVWEDGRNGVTSDIYGQHVSNAGTMLWPANGAPICTANANQLAPRLIRDGAGAHILAWFDYRSGNADIYAQRVDFFGAPMWMANGVPLCIAPGLQELPTLASDGGSGAIVTWRDLREGSYYDVYAERVNETPTPAGRTPRASTLRVLPNFPNPFNTGTTFELVLPSASDVEIDMFDVAGHRVSGRRIDHASAGAHTIALSATASDGTLLRSGVYFCRVTAAGETVTTKMVIAR